MGDAPDVVVVGAGLSGLSAALRLQGVGAQVTVVDPAPRPGGKVRTEYIGGHAFDIGATVLTMPALIEDAMSAVGVTPDETRARLGSVRLDPAYWMRYADGSALQVHRDPVRFADAIEDTFGADQRSGYLRLRDWLSRLYDVEFDTFVDRDFDGLADFFAPDTRSRAARLVAMGGLRTLTSAIGRFVSDPRLQRVFTFQALYAGVPPNRAPAIYAIISHMDVGLGVYYCRGGMGTVGDVMAEAFTAAGGRMVLGTAATGVRVSGGRARAVTTTDGDLDCAAVVLGTDTPVTERLLPQAARRRRIRWSPSAVVVHGTLPTTVTDSWPGGHHTLDFGAAWDETFREITATPGRLMTDPSFLLTRPGRTDPDTFIRDGLESVSVLAPCPNLHSADLRWDVISRPYVAEILDVLERRGYPGISGLRVLRVDDPSTWASADMPAGTPFSAAHTLLQTGPLRTPTTVPGVANVVLSGAQTLPGVGIPPVLVSGGLAARRVSRLVGLPRS